MNLFRNVMTAAVLLSMVYVSGAVNAAESSQKKEAPVALDGNCAVCLLSGKKVVSGKPEFSVVYDGQTYLFPSEEVKQKFQTAPEKYVPALKGDCTVCYAHHDGLRNPGKIDHISFYEGRVFLFPNESIKAVFDKSPAEYADVDLACDGKCIVCKVDGGKDVPGKPEFTAIYQGLRYQFPSQAVMQKFQKDSAKYVASLTAKKVSTTEAPAASELVSISGTTGCAACEYGVHPKQDPDELGLAVKSNDGKIYVIEGAHASHPDLYKSRFQSLKVSVKGKQIANKGKFVWLKPQSIDTAQ
ncbi:YHS domain-containing protein [Gimesia maris]|uniref:YHS domain protein n=1 Tax=Gimesia maris TaxID=122 RepID=A0ABX5YUC6_9PLAN|nr:YHS domain-containing protein [Gimesia maris]QDU17260.1 YHS domain protein [Gimesia maris]QEG19316.1 YHS domain protein [Gimesia maris]